jgi:hydrogenase nickel incorporation protein HypA/HybF
MHELALCRSLLAEVERVARAHSASTVTRVLVVIGPLSGVEPALLGRAFLIARSGGPAEAATLEIEASPLRMRCLACGAEQEVAANRLACGICGGERVRLLGGDELLLKRVELKLEDAAAGAGNDVGSAAITV